MSDDEIDFMHEYDYFHCWCDDCIEKKRHEGQG